MLELRQHKPVELEPSEPQQQGENQGLAQQHQPAMDSAAGQHAVPTERRPSANPRLRLDQVRRRAVLERPGSDAGEHVQLPAVQRRGHGRNAGDQRDQTADDGEQQMRERCDAERIRVRSSSVREPVRPDHEAGPADRQLGEQLGESKQRPICESRPRHILCTQLLCVQPNLQPTSVDD